MASAEINEQDVEAVVRVVRSGRLALGPEVLEFEKAMAAYVGVKHAIAVNSGTAALHLIVKSMGFQKGDEILVPSYTFAASVNALLFEELVPVFVDIDPETYNLDVKDMERKAGPRCKGVMVVDVFGHPAPWTEIEKFCRARGLKIIDDSCEALGAEIGGRKIGSFGDAAAFAFYPNKQITTGEGGIIVTNDDTIARLCRSYRNQGRDEMGQWLEHVRLGYNYRMDEMSAALGRSQLSRIDQFIASRARVASEYTSRLSRFGWAKPPVVKSGAKMSWFVYVVTLDQSLDRDEVIRMLQARGIPARAYFSPIHKQAYLMDVPQRGGESLPVTESVSSRTLALPFFNQMTAEQVETVVRELQAVAEECLGRRKKAA